MPRIDQRDALGVLTKPRLLEIAAALDLGLAGRLAKPELVDAIGQPAHGGFLAESGGFPADPPGGPRVRPWNQGLRGGG